MNTGLANTSPFRLHHGQDHAAHRCVNSREPHMLSTFDPRWVMAVRVVAEFDLAGTIDLPAQSRERLVKQAAAMGLNRFNADSIIALCTAEARDARDPLGPGIERRLATINNPAMLAESKQSSVSVLMATLLTLAVIASTAYVVLTA